MAMRYNHAAMAAHAVQQANLASFMNDQKAQADRIIHSVAGIWTAHGSNAAQEAHQQIALAFAKVFQQVGDHGQAIHGASNNAGHADLSSAAGFRQI